MKKSFVEEIKIPEGVSCTLNENVLTCEKSGVKISKSFKIPRVETKIENNSIILKSNNANKIQYKIVKSYIAHINNIFKGLDENYKYTLEACNVHFPMTLKLEKDVLIINNFLGEKVSRKAKIDPSVKVNISGTKIVLTSHDKEAIGKTTSNIERATHVRNRDRRIFQDGIFLTEKTQGASNA